MPLYDYRCHKCGKELTVIRPIDADTPRCCEVPMGKLLTFPAMVKIKGEGGYPSRRKFVKGTAPNVSRVTKPWLSVDPNSKTDYGFGSA